MSPEQPEAPWPVTRRVARTVVVVDVVEYVRLMERDEEDTVRRWQRFVGEVVTMLLPQYRGRFVKSTGDGMVIEFEAVPPAIQCAIAMQSAIAQHNTGRSADASIFLRIGAHVGDIFADEHDIQGKAVNLAARLTTLAGPGEIVVSADLRDQLVHGLDAEVEDLGECFVKHLPEPVRAYRVGPAGERPAIQDGNTLADQMPVLAVLPLRLGAAGGAPALLGDIVADDIIAALSTSPHWKVISHLSSAVFRDRVPRASEVRRHLSASYVLSGSCHASGHKLRVVLELADARTETVAWSGSVAGHIGELTDPDGELAATVAAQVGRAIFTHELERTRAKPMPTLESYTLLFAAITLMHRLSLRDFERSKSMLEHLVERHPHAPAPRVWLGKWHVMKVAQGWSRDIVAERQMAQKWVRQALDTQPDDALGLAIDGLISGYLFKDLDVAESRYDAAISANPNESLAWLFSSALHAYRGNGEHAAASALRALSLSPLDPLKYYYDSFATHAMVAAGRYADAIRFGQQSLRENCTHAPTFRTLAIAHVLNGDVVQARDTIRRMLVIEPQYTVALYRSRYPGGNSSNAQTYARALREAGLPES